MEVFNVKFDASYNYEQIQKEAGSIMFLLAELDEMGYSLSRIEEIQKVYL